MRKTIIPFATLALISVGCSTTKTIVERDTVTVYQERGDSVNIITKTNIKDSVRIKDSTVVHVNENGDVVKTESWHDREHITSVSDSTQFYKEQFAALTASYTRLKEEKRKTSNAALTTGERLKYGGKGAFVGIIIGFLLALALWLALRKKPP